MRKFCAALVSLSLLFNAPAFAQQTPAPAGIEGRVESILSRLTLEEKIDLIGGVNDFFIRGVERLGVPRLKMADGPAGVRNFGPATAMPAGIALAATWNPALVEQMREGATVYLPVFQPGALLFIGDGHAQQGDGELPGQGLETSMDVQFTVDVIPGKAGGHPRVENAEFVMIMGTGVTLDAAMRTATTEMSRWLATTYQLTPQEIAPLLGTAMQYEIAEVVDSEYNVVAKLPRATLAQIRK